MNVDITKVKTDIFRLIDLVNNGQTVTIVKDNKPVADIVKYKNQKEKRLGLLRGKFDVPEDFNNEDSEINSMFYGKSF
jgi:antitoxin (DNA-binding transcriptional repressor) of toxin-antitoxin stability system